MCPLPALANIALDEPVNDDGDATEEDITETESEDDEWNEDNNMTLRAKWALDGASSIDECIEKLNHFIEYLKRIKEEGWELIDPVNDDYGFLRKKEQLVTSPQTTN